MRKLLYNIKPESGLSAFLHVMLNALLPTAIVVLVRINLDLVAVFLVVLSKWRMFAIKPRYWISNIRANLVDISIGLSMVAFIAGTDLLYVQIFWAVIYTAWLVWLKPKSKPIAVMSQALIAQALALVAFYRAFPDSSLLAGVIIVWIICYACARHFLGAFEEPLVITITNIWAWFGAMMAWILGHWVIEYLFLPQIALILTILGYGFATIYYLHKHEKLKSVVLQQLVGVMVLLMLIIIVFSDWQDKTV